MNKKQQKAIEDLNEALAKAHKAGIWLCGMDHNLYFSTNKAIEFAKTIRKTASRFEGDYCDVAIAYQELSRNEDWWDDVGELYSNGYDDSGGW